MTFAKLSDLGAPPVREAGGDNEVPRDGLGRPRILYPCDGCDGSGRAPSEKRPGKTVKCPNKCGPTTLDSWIPEGMVAKSHTRTTTYIDVLEDKSNLEQWHKRMVLLGVDKDRKLLNGVTDYAEQFARSEDADERKKAKDWLNRRAETATEVAGAKDKAEQGTWLHSLSERVDSGLELPDETSFEDIIDMEAYAKATQDFDIVLMERLMVLDELRIGGTPDRVSRWVHEEPLEAPDGTKIGPQERLITDLKTGTVDYGALKMAMQLAIYSRSKVYLPETGGRESVDNLNQKWGVIMHVPAGQGEATLYWADLTLGWEAVQVATQVRALRSKQKNALTELRHVSIG